MPMIQTTKQDKISMRQRRKIFRSRTIFIAAIRSENSDFGQNSDQNDGKCSFGQKKVRILESSQKFRKVGQNAGKTNFFLKKLNFDKKKTNFRCFSPKFGARNFLFFILFSRRFLGVGFLVPPTAPLLG